MSKRPAPSRSRRLLRWGFRLSMLGLFGAGVGAVVLGIQYKRHVIDAPGDHVSRDHILEVIAQESPVLFADGKTRVGVFFASEHREYVPFSRIPDPWVDAIVASEDQRFHDHPGVDLLGISRAMVRNVQAGRVVAGGSSLTQQTAKNLYYRPDRSLRSKWDELVNALRLEAHHSKSDILEFYANQFHVSANGRGLGIAARYFFDKEVEELDVLECAFIAGMVKAPASYNPFVGGTEERRADARARAQVRTRYVLDRMLELGSLSAADHAALVAREIPFKRGTFRYDSHVIIDEVARRLDGPPFDRVFAELDIDNPSTAGIQVVTTIDAGAQRDATYGLWHHLTEVGPLLEGQGVDDLFLPASSAPGQDPDNLPEVHTFTAARVISSDAEARTAVVDIGGAHCIVDKAGMERMAHVLARARKGEKWRTANKSEVQALAGALTRDRVVWVSVRSPGLCDLEIRPALQGGVLAIQEGQIRAMVGGHDNKDFNRALEAKRQLGSTWKPVVYAAALSLGWSPADALDNREAVFPFEGTWYYPRPDHQSDPFVSLSWAGVRSENLASIWMLQHLSDRLDAQEFDALVAHVGLSKAKGESQKDWIQRIRDTYGVISTPGRIGMVGWEAARAELLAEGELDPVEARELRSLLHGQGVESERAKVIKGSSGSTRARKLAALDRNFLLLQAKAEACMPQAEGLVALSEAGQEAVEPKGLFGFGRRPPPPSVPNALAFDKVSVRVWAGGLEMACGTVDDAWSPVSTELLGAMAAGVGTELGEPGNMWVDGRLRASTIQGLAREAAKRALVLDGAALYDMDVLRHHPDFRTLVNIRYVSQYAAAMGVAAELPPVLSLPLGAADLSLAESATLYQGMLSGKRWGFPGKVMVEGEIPGLRSAVPVDGSPEATLLIKEIRDRHGNVLYRAQPVAEQVAEAEDGVLMAHVLRNVVRWGTGRRAASAVQLNGETVPLAGKTGTTNGFRNAAFVGYAPMYGKDGWGLEGASVIAAYVGYDDNREMRRGGVRLAGASGALPAWIGAARGLADAGLLGDPMPGRAEIDWPGSVVELPVADGTGLQVDAEAAGGRGVLVRGGGVSPWDPGGTPEIERAVSMFRRTRPGPRAHDGGGGPVEPATPQTDPAVGGTAAPAPPHETSPAPTDGAATATEPEATAVPAPEAPDPAPVSPVDEQVGSESLGPRPEGLDDLPTNPFLDDAVLPETVPEGVPDTLPGVGRSGAPELDTGVMPRIAPR